MMEERIKTEFWKIPCRQDKRPLASTAKPEKHTQDIDKVGRTFGVVCGERNNLTVIDLDTNKWESFDRHPFIEKFGRDFIEKFDTYTVQTVRGGYHLYFEFDDMIPQTQKGRFDIDVRGHHGYAVGAGSFVRGHDTTTKQPYEGYYRTCHDVEVKPMPEDLKQWMLEVYYEKTKQQIIKATKWREQFNAEYTYTISRDDIEVICETIKEQYPQYLNCEEDWLKFTSFCKILNVRDLWTKYSKLSPKYDKVANANYWERADTSKYAIVEHFICKVMKSPERLPYYRYKPVVGCGAKPDIVYNRRYLDPNGDYIKQNTNYVFQSDTGTGKSSALKFYFGRYPEQKFISIVSRASLADEQYDVFNDYLGKHGSGCVSYNNEPWINQDDNAVICIDSLVKVKHIDFSEYVVFVDELSSVIEHLIMSDTMHGKRIKVFKQLGRMIKNCKQFIGADADMTNNCFKFLNYCGLNYSYERNEYKNAKGKIATEWTDKHELLAHIRKLNKYIICCDSAREAQHLYDDLVSCGHEIFLYIGGFNGTTLPPKFDKHDKIIFSPRCIYGIDSVMKRPVFAIMRSQTINPKHMIQQINRCRDIEYIGYIFLNKNPMAKVNSKGESVFTFSGDVKHTYFRNKDDVKDFTTNLYEKCDIENLNNKEPELMKLFIDMLNDIIYEDDCYSSNKFLHFKLLLRDRGIIDNDRYVRISKYEYGGFDDENTELGDFECFTEHNKRINEILHIPTNQMKDYREWFEDGHKLTRHFNMINMFFKETDELEHELGATDDFKYHLLMSDKNKVLFLKKLIEAYDGTISDGDYQIKLNKDIEKDEATEIADKYKLLFKCKSTTLDLTKKTSAYKLIKTISNKLFAFNIVNSGRKQINGVRRYVWYFNSTIIDTEESLYNFRRVDNNAGFDD